MGRKVLKLHEDCNKQAAAVNAVKQVAEALFALSNLLYFAQLVL